MPNELLHPIKYCKKQIQIYIENSSHENAKQITYAINNLHWLTNIFKKSDWWNKNYEETVSPYQIN